MSWFPLLEGGEDEDSDGADAASAAPAATRPTEQQQTPAHQEPLLPPPLGSPLEHDMSFLAIGSSTTMSPSEGCGRPLTAPPGDRSRGPRSRPRPGRREGLGRPMSATPSDKSFGMQRLRPGKSEGFGRPITALPSDHSGSGSPAWGLGSPHGFRCEETAVTTGQGRPATAPAFAAPPGVRRQSFSNLSGSQREEGGFGERFGREGDLEVDGGGEESSWTGGAARHDGTAVVGGGGGGGGGAGALCRADPPRECWT